MRRKLLNDDQEKWLFRNYADKSNEEIAEELTKMVMEENQKELKSCLLLLENGCGFRKSETIISRMRTLENFKCVTTSFVKKTAKKLGCRGKSPLCISRQNREKAENAYWNRIIPMAVSVPAPYEWFRTFRIDEQKVALMEDDRRYKSMRNSICNWNRDEGTKKGMVLVPYWNQKMKAVKVVAKSLYR